MSRAAHVQGVVKRGDAPEMWVRLPLSKSCAEGGLSRADRLSYDGHEQILAYVSQGGKRMRSQELRLLPAAISAASPHNLLQGKSL
jgi:hypothetical protein